MKCERITSILQKILSYECFWGCDFLISKEGEPLLIDINFGRVCGGHYPRLFGNLFAQG